MAKKKLHILQIISLIKKIKIRLRIMRVDTKFL